MNEVFIYDMNSVHRTLVIRTLVLLLPKHVYSLFFAYPELRVGAVYVGSIGSNALRSDLQIPVAVEAEVSGAQVANLQLRR